MGHCHLRVRGRQKGLDTLANPNCRCQMNELSESLAVSSLCSLTKMLVP